MAETIYYAKNNVQVTNARAIMGGKTFAMSNITSVNMETIAPPAGFAIGIAGVGIMLGFLTFVLDVESKGPFLILALVLIGIGIAWASMLKPSYAVQIGSASGETKGMTSQSKSEIEAIVAAMNQSIIERG